LRWNESRGTSLEPELDRVSVYLVSRQVDLSAFSAAALILRR
jgi:hypothetical protein